MITAVLCCAFLVPACSGCVVTYLGGSFSKQPGEIESMSQAAKSLVAEAFADIGDQGLFDYHTHIVGLGKGGTGIEVNPRMQSWLHPAERLKFKIYVSASGITDLKHADQQYVDRLLKLIQTFPKRSRHAVIAFERYHNEDGTPNFEKSELHVPNDYIYRVAKEHPQIFETAVSIHPYRPDAVAELEKWAARGVHFVKWLPNAMRINPADPRTKPFYAVMRKHKMVLITHAGEEKAVESEDEQRLGNPLYLRVPLGAGVRVVVAHCASLGKNPDFETPSAPLVDNFDLFMRLFEDARYRGLLFGEISAMTQANRLSKPIITLLERPDLHARLVNGSDYPLPAVNVVIRTGALQSAGLITAEERVLLNEIYDYNPLLFDYVTKRTLRHPAERSKRLHARIFGEHPALK